MKYIAPEFATIVVDTEDIILASKEGGAGDDWKGEEEII